jgi:hypothetical protein
MEAVDAHHRKKLKERMPAIWPRITYAGIGRDKSPERMIDHIGGDVHMDDFIEMYVKRARKTCYISIRPGNIVVLPDEDWLPAYTKNHIGLTAEIENITQHGSSVLECLDEYLATVGGSWRGQLTAPEAHPVVGWILECMRRGVTPVDEWEAYVAAEAENATMRW